LSVSRTDFRPEDWPVLVTGASGFLGGHVARDLARAGHPVKGLSRRIPVERPGDPPIDWVIGDLRQPLDRLRGLKNVRAVVHSAGWVSLGSDPRGEGRAVNVEATRGLLADSIASKVERFVFTSTSHTLAAGSAEAPADESTAWNLSSVTSPYEQTKREAEAIVLDGLGGKLPGVALCPGMVIGPRDPKPTSTSLLILMARSPIGFLPGGGIPVIDASVAALAHRRAIERGEPGTRYALVGPYLEFRQMARLVGQVTGWPMGVFPLPDFLERPLVGWAGMVDRLSGGRWIEVSRAAVAGGFLRLRITGAKADQAFGLVHPPPIVSIYQALEDAGRNGLAPGMSLRKPPEVETGLRAS
jgi:dihydroflavonol-4-reductase